MAPSILYPQLTVSGRPAFDCSGSVVISFCRGSRNITIKYKHTPFHMTVAELYDHFAPAPPLVPAITTTPKSAKLGRKRDGPNGTGEGSSRQKSRKKSGVETDANGESAAGPVPGNGITGAESLAAGSSTNQPAGTPQTKPKRKRQYNRKEKESAVSEPGQQGDSAGPAGSVRRDFAAQFNPIVNVDPEEAARRRQKATEILSNAGVDPGSLSIDQFSIFANQSPALQQESLVMLVEYGAERLRIVHPNRDDSAQNTTQDQTAVPPPASTVGTSTTGPQTSAAAAAADAPASRTKRPKVTRGSCTNCRGQKGVKVRFSVYLPLCQPLTPIVRARETGLPELH